MSKEWKKIKEESYKAGWRKMLRKTFLLPNGKTLDYDIKNEPAACHIFALTPENNVILEKYFRPGTETINLEMPAGFVDAGEVPEISAKRELLEETGMEGQMELAGTSSDDAYSNTVRYTFVAKNCVRVKEPNIEDDEDFEIVELTIDEFRKHLKSGLITHVESGYLALDHLGILN